MAISIFNIEIRLDINKEFRKMIQYLHKLQNTTFSGNFSYTFIEAVNHYSFKQWPYRGTALNCEEYLDNIGLSSKKHEFLIEIEEKKFLYYLEFIYNIYDFSHVMGYIKIENENVKAVINNINVIVEKMNYKFVFDNDKYLLVKRNSEVDSVLNIVDEDIAMLLLEYNDFKVQNDIKRKNEILKSIDKYIEKQQSEFSKLDKDSYNSFGYILNNFGINHKINDKFKDLNADELLIWYDKAFEVAIHLIRLKQVKAINKERKELEK